MQYQWMFDGVASEVTKQQRARVIEMVEAAMALGQGRVVLNWRISGKLAQSALLTRATFNEDAADAAWAHDQTTRLSLECTSFPLS